MGTNRFMYLIFVLRNVSILLFGCYVGFLLRIANRCVSEGRTRRNALTYVSDYEMRNLKTCLSVQHCSGKVDVEVSHWPVATWHSARQHCGPVIEITKNALRAQVSVPVESWWKRSPASLKVTAVEFGFGAFPVRRCAATLPEGPLGE